MLTMVDSQLDWCMLECSRPFICMIAYTHVYSNLLWTLGPAHLTTAMCCQPQLLQ
jgi:hypothetical protein